MTDEVREIPLEMIEPDPNQPRKTFPPAYIAELAASIRKRGLRQPITLRPHPLKPGRFMIVMGECRWRAHAELGRPTIRALVEEMSERDTRINAIIENLQRLDMNPIDEANAYQSLVAIGYTPTQIAHELSVGVQRVQNRLDLLELAEDVRGLVISGNLSTSMAWAVRLAPANQQPRIVREINAGRLRTVEQVRHACIALRDAAAQTDAFAGMITGPSKADLATVSRLERKIEDMASAAAAGFKDGECVAAQRVSPARVHTMADKLALIRKHILQMEHDLRRAATQREIVMGEAA